MQNIFQLWVGGLAGYNYFCIYVNAISRIKNHEEIIYNSRMQWSRKDDSILYSTARDVDEIAKGLSPFNVDAVAVEAGRLMLNRIAMLLEKGETFSIENNTCNKIVSESRKESTVSRIFCHASLLLD